MSYQIIDGKAISKQIKEECRLKAERYKAQGIEITDLPGGASWKRV